MEGESAEQLRGVQGKVEAGRAWTCKSGIRIVGPEFGSPNPKP